MALGYWGVTCAILVPGVLLASWIDYSQRRVPNWLNAALLAAGLIAQGVFNGTAGVGDGLMGMLVGFGLLIVPWLMHGMGAGDVKLMAAIGAWFGPAMTFYSFALGAIIGGVAAVVMILSTRRLKHACSNLGVILAKCSNTKTMFSDFGSAKSFGATSQLLPYGVPLTAGSLIMLVGRVWGGWGM
ncbi:MAG: prepilin peptidase [Phycisphaerales bacterium]|nr:prepilin peptidase [Phycisphaerales bacterium]